MTGPKCTFLTVRQAAKSSAIICLLFVGSVCAVEHSSSAAVSKKVESAHASIKSQLVGSWRLRSRESRRLDGRLEPDPGLATMPTGTLTYDRSGHVAVQLSRQNRTVETMAQDCQAAAATKGKPGTAQTVLGYDAYFGTYSVNESESRVTHYLEAAIFPGDIGKDIQRHYVLKGDVLTLSFETTTDTNVRVTRTLVWERMT